ncbi:MAG TPA: DUF4838 domain-containing protein [Chthoniobacteraceae bacterium]|jgi:tetratricopeptide (TPR) repeat protein|nr:DUF4838 domain-containing protein [Chthoniobacteraceae bacterium]
MKCVIPLLIALLLAPLTVSRAAEAFLVENGQPRAEIVIAEQPPRTVRLAAQELQTYVEKISGARLPIATQPTEGIPVQLYVGRSAHTDRLKETAEGLRDGAYRIASGDRWLVLIGDDTEFTPIEPWAKSNSEIVSGKVQAEWEKIVGAPWGMPGILMYKHQLSVPASVGRPAAEPAPAKAAPWRLWEYDERGSFNAVNGFLQRLGVRWYMPGELGEVVPTAQSIALPKLDETVRPDVAMRRFSFPFGVVGYDTSLWLMRLRLRNPWDIQQAHGLDQMTSNQATFAAHPDWFALYGGKRHFDLKENNQLCYSNDELFQATVKYVRAQFDHYKLNAVSVMPPDGYTAMCQCPLCAGKDSPERDKRGLLSDYVWDFVNRVAKETGKTHPDKKVLNCAYGIYSLPPLKIAKLEPNVVVSIVGGRVPFNNKPAQQEEYRRLRESWQAKTDNPLIDFENYPFTDRGWYLPAFTPHSIGTGINALKGHFQGEDISMSVYGFEKPGVGFNHFLAYFTAAMYWGGKEQDVDAIFREYCRLFYGPAAEEMRAFFEYGEANWQEMEKDKTKVDRALELFAAAQAKADAGSVYGRRMALTDDFLKALRSKSAQLGRKRGPVPVLRLVGEAKSKIVIDGKLDDEAWEKCPVASTGRLRELQTGRLPTFGTTVKAAWIGHDLYFAIRCDEHPGEKLNIGATRKDDSALWYGDVIEVLLETEAHSYYQIAVNPAGAVADLDRGVSPSKWFTWDSNVEVATQIADDHWTVELRIPITQDEIDPLHEVIGRHPGTSLPWHINVCRQRIRERGQEYSALSPTGTDGFHVPMKFATFYDGNSHEFDADPPEDDFLQATRAAADFARQGKRVEALGRYFAAVDAGSLNEVQKSYALEQAAGIARGLSRPEVADQAIAGIPIAAVKKAAWMQSLLDQNKSPQVIEQFAQEDIAAWPFWKAGDGYFARGRAYLITKAGREAEADFLHALEWTAEPRARDTIRQLIGRNRETNLQDDDGALAAWHEVIDHAQHIGAAEQYDSVLGIARILTKRGRFDDALATLRAVPLAQAAGVWRGTLLLAQGDTLQAAARPAEARAVYESVIADATIGQRLRTAAEAKLGK